MANLNEILNSIGVTGEEPAHHRTNLVSAIEAFAILHKNPELERECEAYREQVRTAIEAKRQAVQLETDKEKTATLTRIK